MTTKVIGILQNLHFMEGASLDVLKQLARGVKVRNINPGQVIMHEGSIGRDMFLILEGVVEVVKGQGKDSTVQFKSPSCCNGSYKSLAQGCANPICR
jgi:CRP-like cAMP-binding protein